MAPAVAPMLRVMAPAVAMAPAAAMVPVVAMVPVAATARQAEHPAVVLRVGMSALYAG